VLNLSEIRNKHYSHQRGKLINMDADIDDWKCSPYNCFKARVYIELSSLLVFVLQFTRISPNQVTLVYAISGLLGGVLLSLNNDTLVIIACLIFYFKGTFDWTDGLLARIKNKTSSFGHILDAWGSNVGYIFFVSGFSIYCFNITNNNIYIFILVFFLIIKTIDFKIYLYQQSFYEILNNTQNIDKNFLKRDEIIKEKKNYIYIFLKAFMDDRARTTDFVLLLIILNILYGFNFLIEVAVISYFIKSLIVFIINFYLLYKKN
tara:strand:- start:4441 stop:5226 length:786 start_codon:yes stop_codon:yes gene_type:complete